MSEEKERTNEEKSRGFKDKVALVVGGASGMGNAVVQLLSRAGCRTHILDVKDMKDDLFQECDDCPFMTGALVSADGGYTCQ